MRSPYFSAASGVYGRNICYGDGGDPGAAGRAAVLLPQETLPEARQAAAAAAGKLAWQTGPTPLHGDHGGRGNAFVDIIKALLKGLKDK